MLADHQPTSDHLSAHLTNAHLTNANHTSTEGMPNVESPMTTATSQSLTRSLSGDRMKGPYSPPAFSSRPTGDNIPANICRPRDCR